MSEIIYNDSNPFYVYTYHDEDDLIYYVGKGKGRRMHISHGKYVPVPVDVSKRRIIKENLTEQEAFELEIEQIKLYGRLDIGTGILLNRTNGGGSGPFGYKHSDEAKKKIKEARLGKKASPTTLIRMSAAQSGKNNPMYGKKHSDEAKKKISKAFKGENHPNYGKPVSDITKAKLSEMNSGGKHPQYGTKQSLETRKKITETKKRNKEAKLQK